MKRKEHRIKITEVMNVHSDGPSLMADVYKSYSVQCMATKQSNCLFIVSPLTTLSDLYIKRNYSMRDSIQFGNFSMYLVELIGFNPLQFNKTTNSVVFFTISIRG